MFSLKLKRIYELPQRNDGERILVDRLWPRGISKQKAGVDLWLKDIAPSNDLRKWFHQHPDKWSEFQKKYRVELKNKKEIDELRKEIRKKNVTLLFSASDEKHNNAVALKNIL